MEITGASGAIPVSDQKRRNAHARLYYDEIRKRSTDVQAIVKNTGWDSTAIEKIKSHVFFTEHDLGYEFPARFDPDYNMSISWQRLIEGSAIQEEDHIKASEQFDYAALIKRREE
jgi:hypothetical protein